MDNKKIEILAIATVKESIMLCDYLDQYISENDKEPSWDGNIYIYNTPTHTKDNIFGRVAVQVKGTQQLDVNAESVKFSVDVVDLKNYLRDGGVIYFVVALSANATQKTIFYDKLTPVKLKMILETCEAQKTVTHSFSRFPTDNTEKANVFMNFYEDHRKQSSFTSDSILDPEELENNPALEGFEITHIHVGSKETFEDSLLNSQPYLYARIKGCPIPQPLLIEPHSTFIKRKIHAKIDVNGIEYYKECDVIKTKDEIILKVGGSVSAEWAVGSNTGTVKIHLAPMLSDRMRDLRFIIAMAENAGFNYNGNFLTYNSELPEDKTATYKKLLQFYEDLDQLLKLLRVQTDIDISKYTKDDLTHFRMLISTVLKKEPLQGLKDRGNPHRWLKIGEHVFILWIEDDDRVYDFFSHEASVTWKTETDEFSTSHYVGLGIEEVKEASNLYLGNVVAEFAKHEENPQVFVTGNHFLLTLLMAVDQGASNREMILQCAYELSEWLLNTPDELIPRTISIANRMQVIKRMRALSEEETNELWRMIDEYPSDKEFIFCAYILLDAHMMANRVLKQMPPDFQMDVESMPIYHLMSTKKSTE